MILDAVNISKFYGARQALAGVSFSLGEGETAALLGMTGSGKSTVMRILSGFLAPTHGTARIGGEDPRHAATRQYIGYLPEKNPLPLQSRVRDYLRFRAGLKGLAGRAGAAAAAETAGLCRLDDVMDMLIGHLPQETRQRVGLAECMLAKPAVLLLDDPMAMLDAREAHGLRDIIEQAARGAAALFATASLGDAERLCGRAVVLDKGRVVADGDIQSLRDRNTEERIVNMEMICSDPVRETLRAIPGVRTVSVAQHAGESGLIAVRIATAAGIDLRHRLSQVCAERGWIVTSMRLEPIRLEDIFPKLASRAGNTRRIK